MNLLACFFHLKQTVFRRVQAEGLQAAYNDPDDRSIKEAAQMICALAFVPVEDVEKAFDIFVDRAPEAFMEVADYFEKTYVRTASERKEASYTAEIQCGIVEYVRRCASEHCKNKQCL